METQQLKFLLEQLNFSVATGQEFDEGVVEAAAALNEAIGTVDDGEKPDE